MFLQLRTLTEENFLQRLQFRRIQGMPKSTGIGCLQGKVQSCHEWKRELKFEPGVEVVDLHLSSFPL